MQDILWNIFQIGLVLVVCTPFVWIYVSGPIHYIRYRLYDTKVYAEITNIESRRKHHHKSRHSYTEYKYTCSYMTMSGIKTIESKWTEREFAINDKLLMCYSESQPDKAMLQITWQAKMAPTIVFTIWFILLILCMLFL